MFSRKRYGRPRKRGGSNNSSPTRSPTRSPKRTWKTWLMKHKYTIGAGIAVITAIVAAERLRDPNSSISKLKTNIFNKIGAEVPTSVVTTASHAVDAVTPTQSPTTPDSPSTPTTHTKSPTRPSTHAQSPTIAANVPGSIPTQCAQSDQVIDYDYLNFDILMYGILGHDHHYTGLYKCINYNGESIRGGRAVFKKVDNDNLSIAIDHRRGDKLEFHDETERRVETGKDTIRTFEDIRKFQTNWLLHNLRLCPVLNNLQQQKRARHEFGFEQLPDRNGKESYRWVKIKYPE